MGWLQYPMQKIGITAGFGPYTVNGVRKPHNGADICAQSNTDVCAAHDGTVIFSLYDSAGGNMIALRGAFNEKADVITRYAHLASRAVEKGQAVIRGEVIGQQGATGSACFGRHLHFETWLVPKDYVYNYADRVKYAVDPLSLCHTVQGQTFIADEDTFGLAGIPYPEPTPNKLCELGEGSVVRVENGGVRVRLVPWTAYPPLVADSSSRSRDTLVEWWGDREFRALYSCETEENGKTTRWAMIDTPLGGWWVALLDGYTELVEAAEEEGGGCSVVLPVCDQELLNEVDRLGKELKRLADITNRQQELIAQTLGIWTNWERSKTE